MENRKIRITFKRGDIITMTGYDGVMAIWSDRDEPSTEYANGINFLLMAYSDPTYIEKGKNGEYHLQPIMNVGLHGNDCDYYIDGREIGNWRLATKSEAIDFLKQLAKKGYKYDDELHFISKLSNGERLCFDDDDNPNIATTLIRKNERQRKILIPMDDIDGASFTIGYCCEQMNTPSVTFYKSGKSHKYHDYWFD